MSETAFEIKGLTEAELLCVEAELCRAKNRPIWWQTVAKDFPLGALGRMVQTAINERNRACRLLQLEVAGGSEYEKLDQKDVRALLPKIRISDGSFSRFLNGEPPVKRVTHDYYAIAKASLRLTLLGSGSTEPSPLATKIFNRISGLFFDNWMSQSEKDDDRSFFDPKFQSSDFPTRSREAVAELRSLANAATMSAAKCRVTRVSGGLRLPHFEDGHITDAGQATVECLQAGVKVALVVPSISTKSEAYSSAEEFRQYVQKHQEESSNNLTVVLLNHARHVETPNGVRWAGEYLSRGLRWALYERLSPSEEHILLVARRGPHGPIAFHPDEKEVRDFRDWVETMVWSHPHEHAAA